MRRGRGLPLPLRSRRLPKQLFGYRPADVLREAEVFQAQEQAAYNAWRAACEAEEAELRAARERLALLESTLAAERSVAAVAEGRLVRAREHAYRMRLGAEGEPESLHTDREARLAALGRQIAEVVAATHDVDVQLNAMVGSVSTVAASAPESAVSVPSGQETQVGGTARGLSPDAAEGLLASWVGQGEFRIAAPNLPRRVQTRDGRLLGRLSAVVLSGSPPSIVGFECVREGGPVGLVPLTNIRMVSHDRLVVDADFAWSAPEDMDAEGSPPGATLPTTAITGPSVSAAAPQPGGSSDVVIPRRDVPVLQDPVSAPVVPPVEAVGLGDRATGSGASCAPPQLVGPARRVRWRRWDRIERGSPHVRARVSPPGSGGGSVPDGPGLFGVVAETASIPDDGIPASATGDAPSLGPEYGELPQVSASPQGAPKLGAPGERSEGRVPDADGTACGSPVSASGAEQGAGASAASGGAHEPKLPGPADGAADPALNGAEAFGGVGGGTATPTDGVAPNGRDASAKGETPSLGLGDGDRPEVSASPQGDPEPQAPGVPGERSEKESPDAGGTACGSPLFTPVAEQGEGTSTGSGGAQEPGPPGRAGGVADAPPGPGGDTEAAAVPADMPSLPPPQWSEFLPELAGELEEDEADAGAVGTAGGRPGKGGEEPRPAPDPAPVTEGPPAGRAGMGPEVVAFLVGNVVGQDLRDSSDTRIAERGQRIDAALVAAAEAAGCLPQLIVHMELALR